MENNNVNYFVINEVNDFLRLRNIKENESMVIVINKNINFNDIEFKPINAKTNNIIIYGLNNKISNLKIDNGQEENTGLFSEVKNLYVRGLELDNFSIYGGVCTGSLVGNASEYVSVKNSKFNGLIDAEAYAGGLVGTCKKLELENNNINTMVKAIDVVGGVVGLADEIVHKNNIVDSKIISKGKAKGLYAGYNSKEKEPYVTYLVEESLKHLPIKCNESEMKLLELIIKQNR